MSVSSCIGAFFTILVLDGDGYRVRIDPAGGDRDRLCACAIARWRLAGGSSAARRDNPDVISTNGNWRFNLSHGAMVDGRFVQQAASASGSQAEQPPGNAIDGKMDSRWCATGGDMPQWWQMDLGKLESIAGIELSWENGDGHYRYRVEAGPDDLHLTSVVDETQEPGTGDRKLKWPPTSAKIVRITIVGATDSTGEKRWASIREVRVTVIRDGRKAVWSPAISADADPHADDFASRIFDDKNWHDLPVPSNWEVLGYSRPTYFDPDLAVGLYRRIDRHPRFIRW